MRLLYYCKCFFFNIFARKIIIIIIVLICLFSYCQTNIMLYIIYLTALNGKNQHSDSPRHGTAWHGTARHGTIRHGTIPYEYMSYKTFKSNMCVCRRGGGLWLFTVSMCILCDISTFPLCVKYSLSICSWQFVPSNDQVYKGSYSVYNIIQWFHKCYTIVEHRSWRLITCML